MELKYKHLVFTVAIAFFLKSTLFYDFWVIYNTGEREYRSVGEQKVPVVHRVLITGASKGIGEEVAYQYARQGARIVITARNAASLKLVAERCVSLGAKSADFIAADMNKTEDIAKIMPFVEQKMSKSHSRLVRPVSPVCP